MINPKWSPFFADFLFPYGFYGVDEYHRWLAQAGFKPRRVELIPKDMTHKGEDGFAGWIRSTWLPYLSRIPEQMKEAFIEAILDAYLVEHSPDKKGLIHVDMVRLEVEAVKPFRGSGVTNSNDTFLKTPHAPQRKKKKKIPHDTFLFFSLINYPF